MEKKNEEIIMFCFKIIVMKSENGDTVCFVSILLEVHFGSHIMFVRSFLPLKKHESIFLYQFNALSIVVHRHL